MQVEPNTKCVSKVDTQKYTTTEVNVPIDLVRKLEGDYVRRCLVGLMFGPCPPLEVLKRWIDKI